MQSSPTTVVGALSFSNDIVMVMSDDDAFNQMYDDCAEDDTSDWNDDDYIGGHDDCLREDRGLDNHISNCNYADGSTEHATTVVLEDVECNDLIYNNPIAGDNGIRSPDDNDQERNAVEKVYLDVHNGLCKYHLGKKVKNRFKHEDIVAIFTLVANSYREGDFNEHMNQLNQICKDGYDHLMKLFPKRWARAWSPVRCYKLMTLNIVKCINLCLRWARKMPITVLIECIRGMFQY
ncbi:Uncharacterized protein TCM_035290 [Theobroma cacao]|uniref:Uncharacterized protein n=1 Tax=Theobroma cacao TaxID=3641 RepID=A0A061FGM7_THECC|nr:Uncharacterized protein TCM_035290 [Theobroma cacao]